MRPALRLTHIVLLLQFFAPLVPGSRAPRQDEVIPGTLRRFLFAPYYTVESGWHTVIALNNSTRAPFIVYPTVYSLDGAGLQMPAVRLGPHETKKLEMADWVGPLGGNFQRGSVRLDFDSVSAGLGSVIMATDEQHSLGLNIPVRARTEFKSSQLEAIWKAPDDDARLMLAVTNTTDHGVSASVVFSRPNGSIMKNLPLSFTAHQSRVLNLRELVVREDARFGAISIRHDGAPGAILAEGFVTDAETGFSLNVPFLDPATLGDSKLDGAGVMIGASSDSGQPTQFSGRLLLRNVSALPIIANPVLQRGTSRSELGTVSLSPSESREIIVAPQSAPGGEGGVGIEIQHSGPPGSVIGHWFSMDDSGNLVVETPLRSVGHHDRLGGSNPWSLEGDTTAVTSVKNAGTFATHFSASLSYPGGQYTLGFLEVGPGETYAIDIRQLRDQQIPDVHGHVLPLDLQSGQSNWRWHDGAPIVGRTNVMSRSAAIAHNMSCPSCGCSNPTSVEIQFNPDTRVIVVGQTVQATLVETDTDCSGFVSAPYPLYSGNVQWSSSNSFVAYVDDFGLVYGNSPGLVTITASNTFGIDRFIFEGFLIDGDPIGRCEPDSINVSTDLEVAIQSFSVEVYSPAQNTRFDITTNPLMPTVSALARIVGINPDPTSSTQFAWYTTVDFSDVTGRPFPLILPVQNSSGGSFSPNFQGNFAGGTLAITACASRAAYGACGSDNGGLVIRGLDPTGAQIKSQIQTVAGGPDDHANQLACHESDGMHQFQQNGLPVQSFAGAAGIFQIIFQRTRNDYWDWKSNVSSGINIFNSSRTFARNFPQRVRTQVIRGRGPYPNATDFTDEQVELEAIHRYNNGTSPDVGYWEWNDNALMWVPRPRATTGGDPDFVAHVLSRTAFCRP